MTNYINHFQAEDEKNYSDHSKFLWHLTKDQKYYEKGFPDETSDIRQLPNRIGDVNAIPQFSKGRFERILNEKRLRASKLLHADINYNDLDEHPIGVCLTECIPASLHEHAKRFSYWGFLFQKEYIFAKGGRPALYVELELYNRITKTTNFPPKGPYVEFPKEYIHLFTPFVPNYSHEKIGKDKKYDYMVEREWRIGKNLNFEYEDVYAYLVPNADEWQQLCDRFTELNTCKYIPLEGKDFNSIKDWDEAV